ncbi:MAG: hypothetical protein NTW28_08265 [Candidatus Solibacter sp.]|nr:hypothetical protein [Candidatus Solibacter sp.]
MARDCVIDWLLAGDAAIRWQTLRDLAGASERVWRREQRSVATTGWGARLLALQDADGRWAGGVYTPKWTSTTYTLLLLRDLGLAPGQAQAVRGCRLLLDQGFWSDGGINFWRRSAKRSETCVTAMVLSEARWFGLEDPRMERLVEHLLAAQMPDGGWNCRTTPGYGSATHGSFHTTILALEALLGCPAAAQARARGEEFLLVHRLFRSHRTGQVAKTDFTRFHFPPRWHYDVLRALDYFRAANAPCDARLEDALELVRARSQGDGRWHLAKGHPGKVFFEMEEAGRASRWNTMRALRVLRWAEVAIKGPVTPI